MSLSHFKLDDSELPDAGYVKQLSSLSWPEQDFDIAVTPTEPDYSSANHWAALPGIVNGSTALPEIGIYNQKSRKKEII